MAEWLVEEGIGEHRAVLLEGGQIVAARVDWPGPLSAGQIEDAVLIARTAGSSRGTLRFASGEEALVAGLPREASEGAPLRAVVTRAAIGEKGRTKRAQARPTRDAPRPAPSLAEQLRGEGAQARVVPRFAADWDELFAVAWMSAVAFRGGSLTLSPTPAMTLIDIDGDLPATALALQAVPEIGAALRRFDLGGSIGIDFPSLEAKQDRRAVDEALAAELAGWPHERTAMNGFGFVQLVARLDRPSFLHRILGDRAGAAARALLRRAESIAEPGALELAAPRPVLAAVRTEWRQALALRTGREIRLRDEPRLAWESATVQAVPL